ncbi:hypothetical protein TRVL_09573 [Trypanosoma vivax]|nr:hypothetical protein TRVL_09573 [Trypanosoma vivax]
MCWSHSDKSKLNIYRCSTHQHHCKPQRCRQRFRHRWLLTTRAPSHLRVWCHTVTAPRAMKACTASRIGADLNNRGTHPLWSRCSTSLGQAHFLAYRDVDN